MKKNDITTYASKEEMDKTEKAYLEIIENDPKYSLEIDPEGVYQMNDKQKSFLKYYCEFKNIPLASQLAGIEEKEGKSYWASYGGQREIARVNRAMYMRQFSNKLLSIDEVGGYLSSVLMDEVPMADRLSTKDKMNVAKMLIDINNMKATALTNPETLDAITVEAEIKDLSVKSIKQLITSSNVEEMEEKEKIIEQFNVNGDLSTEEINYLKTLKLSELLNLLEEENSKGDEKGNENK